MTPSEAVQQAMDQHEFRQYRRVAINHNLSDDVGVVAECWCGNTTPTFLTEQSARDAHGRHQGRAALMRSFGDWNT